MKWAHIWRRQHYCLKRGQSKYEYLTSKGVNRRRTKTKGLLTIPLFWKTHLRRWVVNERTAFIFEYEWILTRWSQRTDSKLWDSSTPLPGVVAYTNGILRSTAAKNCKLLVLRIHGISTHTEQEQENQPVSLLIPSCCGLFVVCKYSVRPITRMYF